MSRVRLSDRDDEADDYVREVRKNTCLARFAQMSLGGKLAIAAVAFTVVILIIIVPIYASEKKHVDDASTKPPPAAPPVAPLPPGPAPSNLWNDIRLPTWAIPTSYVVTINPDLVLFEFVGSSVINMNITQATSYVVIHSVDLVLTPVTMNQNGADIQVTSVTCNTTLEYCYFMLAQPLVVGTATISIGFKGALLDNLKGFYRSTYTEFNGTDYVTKVMATTQFEPVDARRAFPCFDEPAMKAVFTIVLIGDPNLTFLSNAEEAGRHMYDANHVMVTYQPTPKMSTYLIAFIFCDFENTSVVNADGTLVRVFTRPGFTSQGVFAAQAGADILTFYTQLFQIPFPLKKCDMIAIPDFAAGAMENWGLITYRDTALLIDPAASSAINYLRVATVVAHELAHQWFGNLVTMDWWDDLWLNEGFATFTEYIGVNAIYPNYDILTQFLVLDLEGALEADALLTSHPVAATVYNPDQISELFDSISYNKGGAILRMIQNYINQKSTQPNAFFQGITNYLNSHAYGNAQTSDLWSALAASSGLPINDIMNNWVNVMGYPVVNLTLNAAGNQMTATQSWYLTTGTAPHAQLWYVPFNYFTSANGALVSQDMTDTTTSINFAYTTGTWVKANANYTGYYRTQYPTAVWDLFSNALVADYTVLNPKDRTSLLMDLFAFAFSGRADPVQALSLTRFLTNEIEYTPWQTGLTGLSQFRVMLQFQSCYGSFQTFVRNLVGPTSSLIGFNQTAGDSFSVQLLRNSLLATAVNNGYQPSVQEALALFDSYMNNGTQLSADIRATVYAAGVAYANDDSAFNFLWQKYLVETFAQEQLRLLAAMAAAPQPYLLQTLLDYSINDKLIRPQDAPAVIGAVAANPYGFLLSWQFFKANIALFQQRYASGLSLIARLISSTTYSMYTTAQYTEVQQFFAANFATTSQQATQQALAHIQSNIDWVSNYGQSVCSYLNSQV